MKIICLTGDSGLHGQRIIWTIARSQGWAGVHSIQLVYQCQYGFGDASDLAQISHSLVFKVVLLITAELRWKFETAENVSPKYLDCVDLKTKWKKVNLTKVEIL